MSLFRYKARNEAGELREGVLDSDDPKQVAQILNSRGPTPVAIQQTSAQSNIVESLAEKWALQTLELTDLILFSRQMYSLQKAGIPLIRAIRSLTESTRNKALTHALKDIAKRLESGNSLSQAMRFHPRIFSPLYISIINVGEATGDIDQCFLQIGQYLEREKETKKRIKSALRYPTMVLIAISVAMVIVNIYVIPSFKSAFDKFHAELPWQTQLLISISNFSVNYWPYLLGGLIIVFFIVLSYIRSESGQLHWHWLILKLPIFGSIVERATMERFSRSFAMILHAGVPLIQGISIVSDALDNRYIESKLDRMRIGIEKGDSISRMAKSIQFCIYLGFVKISNFDQHIADITGFFTDHYHLRN